MLDHRREREQQLALRDEQVPLRLWGYEVPERRPENARRLVDEARRARPTCLGHGFRSGNVTDSMPSSRRPLVTRLPLSTRGNDISRLYGPTLTKSSPSRCLMSTSSLPTTGRGGWSSY